MTAAFLSVGGRTAHSVRVVVGNIGTWHAECDIDDDSELSGRVTISIGTLRLAGAVLQPYDGAHGTVRKCRVVGGAGGWQQLLGAKGYHNDAGVKARLVAEDAAREAGETLGAFVPAAERLGADYAREAGRTAAAALEDVIGGVPWWVDFQGVTHVGTRPAAEVSSAAYDVVAYDPRARIATLAVSEAGAVGIGSVISTGVDTPRAVRQLEIVAERDSLRLVAWLADTDGHDRLTGLVRSIVQRVSEGALYGVWRYRVVTMAGDGRVELQPVSKAAGMPELAPIAMMPGVAGVHAQLSKGAEVLVQFVDGERSQPVITHFAGKSGAGFVPVSLALGAASGPPAARQGDAVEIVLPPAVFSGSIRGAPASGVLTFPINKAVGVITGGSTKVQVG